MRIRELSFHEAMKKWKRFFQQRSQKGENFKPTSRHYLTPLEREEILKKILKLYEEGKLVIND